MEISGSGRLLVELAAALESADIMVVMSPESWSVGVLVVRAAPPVIGGKLVLEVVDRLPITVLCLAPYTETCNNRAAN